MVRRAGSSQIPSVAAGSWSSALPRCTLAEGKGRRFIVATATAAGERSTARTCRPSPARAIESPPMPQPRSATEAIPARAKRSACRAATGRRVACSRPSGVNSIEEANSPNLSSARARSRDWVITAATSSGACPASRRRAPWLSESCSRYGGSEFSSAQPSLLRTGSRARATADSASAAREDMPCRLPAGHVPVRHARTSRMSFPRVWPCSSSSWARPISASGRICETPSG